ncbi:MAG: serine/threonine protein kinase [Elusimicrobia bacterium]|nr:serine/threonine protein kinase [Elusimicrobiota bacterium]
MRILLVLLASAALCRADQASDTRSLALTDDAEQLLKMRDADGAARLAEEAAELKPDNMRALWALFEARRAAKRYSDALEALDRALRVEPRRAKLLNARAETLNRLGRSREALAAAEATLAAADPKYAVAAHVNRALALDGQGQRAAALEALAPAGRLRPDLRPKLDEANALAPDTPLSAVFEGGAKPRSPRAPPTKSPSALTLALGLGAPLLIVAGWRTFRPRRRAFTPMPEPPPTPPATPAGGLAGAGITLGRKIGQGGMGIVYEGLDVKLNRRVALKKMRSEIRSDPRERERFVREAKTVAALRHPNIVEIYAIIEDGSDVFLVFQFVSGKTVHELLGEKGRLPFAYTAALIKAVGAALDYAHGMGVVHRDLKPANIMVEDSGMVKVMDFGVARQAKDALSRMSVTNTVVGTPPYMAPEQEQGVVCPESDVFALGVCGYEMLTGELPYQGIGAGMLMAKLKGAYVPASGLTPGCPPGLDAALARALDPDPERRYPSGSEFAAALAALSAN